MRRWCLQMIGMVGTLVFLFLTIYSWRYTKKIDLYSEELIDIRDSVWRSVLLLILAVEIVFRLGTWKVYLTKKRIQIFAILIAAVVTGICFWLVEDANSITGTDQLHVYMVAQDIANCTGERFISGDDYFYCSPHQLGLAAVYAFIFRMTGNYSEDILRFFHALCGGLIVYMGFLVTRELSEDRRAEIMYLLAVMSFLPLYLYVLFIYGETLGVCGAFFSLWAFLRLAHTEGKRRYADWTVLTVGMSLMYVARKGLIVIWIAMFLVQIFRTKEKKELVSLVLLVGVLICSLGSQSLLIRIAEKRMNADFGNGVSMVSWLAMGMQEHENENLPPGYYNGYHVEVFRDSNYDTAVATAVSKEYIQERWGYWRENPKNMLDFYKEKILGQWNEPTYCAFIMTNLMNEPAEWICDLNWGEGRKSWNHYLDAFQAVVYLLVFGSFLYLLSGKHEPEQYLLGLILLGGFFFSIIWETKSRYIYPYSVLAIPCAAISLTHYYDRLPGRIRQIAEEIKKRYRMRGKKDGTVG